MSREIVLGNGDILVSLDKVGQVRDFYFPLVGSENHIDVDCWHKIGVWIDGQFSWLNSPEWQHSVNYQPEAPASNIIALNERLETELRFLDLVYNEKNIFIRKLVIKNLSNKKRTVKIFFNQQFQIYETSIGNTAFYEPYEKAIIHYKGRRVFLISGKLNGESFNDYSVGLSRTEGKEGTWRDAENGELSKNPIEHGSVDSTLGFTATPDANETFELFYWIAAGKTLNETKELNDYIKQKTPEHLIESTQDFWSAWINKPELDFNQLDKNLIELFKKSLFVIRVHADNRGGIIASGDGEMLQYGRDTYGYIWPRDASFAAMALDTVGYFDVTQRFFEFCNNVLSPDGYFLHKYLPDQSLGSSWHPWIKNGEKRLPIQEDETALVLCALRKHYELAKDLEFIERIYNSLIKKSADFLVDFRDNKTKLPLPSYDLWERLFGISTFTAAAVSAALSSAGYFAKILGKEKDEEKYKTASEEIKNGILNYLWNEKENYFYKLIEIKGEKILHDNTVDISSFYGIFNFDILDINDEKMAKAVRVVESELKCKTAVGGIARFKNDDYHRAPGETPGNPWFITTLWLAQYYIKLAKKKDDLKKADEFLNWSANNTLSSGILPEQLNPFTGASLSASPLTWSHAEFVITIIFYLQKLKELKEK